LELLILSVLDGEDRHGYEIGKLIERRSGGELRVAVSTLYSILYRMEKKRWIKGRWVEAAGTRRRCYYRLTGEGRKNLRRQLHEWSAFTTMVNHVVKVSHA